MLLFLNDIGGSEVLVILFVILIFFGPKSIPGIAKTFGKTIYQIKQASDDLKSEISKSGMDIKKDLNLDGIFKDPEEQFKEHVVAPVERELNEVDKSLNSIAYQKNSPTELEETPEIPTENLAEKVEENTESEIDTDLEIKSPIEKQEDK